MNAAVHGDAAARRVTSLLPLSSLSYECELYRFECAIVEVSYCQKFGYNYLEFRNGLVTGFSYTMSI